MDPLILLSLLLVCPPLGYLAWTLLSTDKKGQAVARDILSRGAHRTEVEKKASTGLLEKIGHRITPSGYVQKLDRLLSLAGRPANLPLGRVLAAKPALGLVGGLVGLWLSSIGTTPIMKLVGIFVLFLGYFIPDLLLYSKGQERQKAMQLELANTLDQMLISVEAGLGFEGAMARAGENGKGPLAEELVRTLQDMQVGRSRRESYLALAERTSATASATRT